MEKHLTLSGTPGMGFTVEASQDNGIGLDDPKEFEINERNTVNVFQFIPPKDISKTQLDITVTSDSDVPSYLKVSQNCQDVKDNIKVVDYKGKSIRLTFARKGRITLSKASIPPLADSASWYIGIALNNAAGTTPLNANKSGTLTLKKSFSYSYAGPMSFICLVPFFGGGIAVVWALICFKEPHVHPLQPPNSPAVTWGEVCTAMGDVIRNHWFAGGPKTFSYITCIVGCVLMVGAFQFVYAAWYLMIQEGDRDHCYYNDFCYRVSSSDIPFNLMSSNFAYIVHAFILALSVLYMEAELLARCKNMDPPQPPPLAENGPRPLPYHMLICPDISPHLASMSVPNHEVTPDDLAEGQKRQFSFSIGYAFAWALLFEGLFSTLYHLCPSKITFQFDMAFMFVISGLIVVVMYNGIKINCQEDGEAGGNVGATNLFLVFIVPLYILNYLGSLNHSSKGLVPTAAWAVPLALWCFIIVNWVGYKLYFENWKWYSFLEVCICKRECKRKGIGLTIGVGIAVFFLCLITIIDSLPQALLITCIAESVVVTMMKVCLGRGCRCECCSLKCFFTWFYVLITIAFLVSAFYIFKAFPTTDKANTPEKSRNENHECKWFGFFDYHDIWHFLSSFGLLMGAHLLMYASYTAPSNAVGEG